MRLRACRGIMLLGLTACEALPTAVRFEIDGTSVEFKKKPPVAPPEPDTPASNGLAGDDGAR